MLMSNHRCARYSVECINGYIRQFSMSEGISGLGPHVTHQVAQRYSDENGLSKLSPDGRKAVLFYALMVTISQPVVQDVEVTFDSRVRTLVSLGLIERATLHTNDQNRLSVSDRFEWEMGPALTLVAAATLVPSLLHCISLADMFEWLSALHAIWAPMCNGVSMHIASHFCWIVSS